MSRSISAGPAGDSRAAATDNPAGSVSRHLTVLEDDLAIDPDRLNADRRRMRLLRRGPVIDQAGIEQYEVRIPAWCWMAPLMPLVGRGSGRPPGNEPLACPVRIPVQQGRKSA